jgi:cellulose synthase/poly-beta-1,6-N-acetylglucosamine synthase-like glycosyltransferase
MQFSFTLKDNNLKGYNQFTWFLFFLHIIVASVFALNTNDSKTSVSIYVLLGFYALLSIVYFFYRTHKKAFETFSLILALLYANFWFQHVGIIAALIFIAVYLVVTIVKGKRTTVLFSDEEIQLTRVFKTVVFPWSEMENVILKDNLLTIDFKTNKIIQVEIVESARAVDEAEFNRFCTEQLSSGDLI